jgi:hypothetical protein
MLTDDVRTAQPQFVAEEIAEEEPGFDGAPVPDAVY